MLLLFVMAAGMDGTCVLLLLCTVWYLLLLFGKRNSVAFVYVYVYKTRHILVSQVIYIQTNSLVLLVYMCGARLTVARFAA